MDRRQSNALVTVVAIVGVVAVGWVALQGDLSQAVVVALITAVAGLGGYQLRNHGGG